jgi:magnesium chelatase family protein
MRECTCGQPSIDRYRAKMSGPLLDRIDLRVVAEPVAVDVLRAAQPGECSAKVRDRVREARERQRARLAPWGLHTNAEMPPRVLRATCPLDDASERELAKQIDRSHSARAIDRLLKLARTIADLEAKGAIDPHCIQEAAYFRGQGELS